MDLLEHRYYIDAFYMRASSTRCATRGRPAVYWFNQNVLDAVVNGAAGLAEGLAAVVMLVRPERDRRRVNGVGRHGRARPAVS